MTQPYLVCPACKEECAKVADEVGTESWIYAADKAAERIRALPTRPAGEGVTDAMCDAAWRARPVKHSDHREYLRPMIEAALAGYRRAPAVTADARETLERVRRLLTYPSDSSAGPFPPLLETPQAERARYDYQNKVIDEAIAMIAAALPAATLGK